MKRKYLVALILFSVLSLLTLTLFQLHAELTLQQVQGLLTNKIAVLNGYNVVLDRALTVMNNAEQDWINNEEDITENRIDYASADLWGLGGAVLKQVMDMQDRAKIAVSLGAAIKAVETAEDDAEEAETQRDTVWADYVRLANEARISTSERYSKGADALPVSYPKISVTCSSCSVTWSGSGIKGLADHITSCSVKGHTNQSGELVSDPLPHFTCQTCPLAHQHYTFACEGGCGDLFPEPTTITSPGDGHSVPSKIYHDHRRDPCGKSTGLLTSCSSRAFTCQTPECSNDSNHLIDGECNKHKVKKGDDAAVAAHQRVGQSCPETYTYPSGRTISCIIYIGYKCDEHSIHDYDPGSGTNPPPESLSNPISTNPGSTTNPPANPSVRPCGHSTSESGDHSLQASCTSTDANGNSCTVTSFYACDSHTHSYPTPPPPPTTVACGAAGWTGCTVMSSDGNACRVDPCGSGCGNYYWSCNPSAVSWHTTSRTCTRTNCGASYTNCTRGNGTCSNGAYIWHKK